MNFLCNLLYSAKQTLRFFKTGAFFLIPAEANSLQCRNLYDFVETLPMPCYTEYKSDRKGRTYRCLVKRISPQVSLHRWWYCSHPPYRGCCAALLEERLEAGLVPKHRGCPRKNSAPRDIVSEQQYEINRLKMENELLRDFLQSVERK